MIKNFSSLGFASLCFSSATAFCENESDRLAELLRMVFNNADLISIENDRLNRQKAQEMRRNSREDSLKDVLALFQTLFGRYGQPISNDTRPLNSFLKVLSDQFKQDCLKKKVFYSNQDETHLLISSLLVSVVMYLIKPGATFDNPLFGQNRQLQVAALAVADSDTYEKRCNSLHAFYNVLKGLEDDVVLALIRFFFQGAKNVPHVNNTCLSKNAAYNDKESDTSLLRAILEYCQFLFPLTKE
jgi:hypothetical protein